jgi:ABC-2 type transport system permease protein
VASAATRARDRAADRAATRAADRAAGRPSQWHAYRTVLASRIRSQTTYRASFALDVFGSLMVSLADLTEVYVIFHNVPLLGGLDLPAAFLVFGLANLGFQLADALFGRLDAVPELIRSGRLDAMMLRPQPLLAQLLTNDVVLRRIGGALVGAVVLTVGLLLTPIDWTAPRLALVVITPFCAAGVFSALFLAAGAVQFWLIDASEVTNAFTYASSYAAKYSSAVLPLPVRLLFAFVVPAAFTAYLPTLALLGRPGPAFLPSWLGWCGPGMAALAWTAALAAWGRGVRHYSGGGG